MSPSKNPTLDRDCHLMGRDTCISSAICGWDGDSCNLCENYMTQDDCLDRICLWNNLDDECGGSCIRMSDEILFFFDDALNVTVTSKFECEQKCLSYKDNQCRAATYASSE